MAVMTYSWIGAPTVTNDATLRAWVQNIHDAFAACGMVQTADTGQVNPATVTYGSGTAYEVWRFDDALQAAAPVFVKIEYTRNATSLGITVGQATDGAGNLSSLLVAKATLSLSASTTEYASYASGDGSSFAIIFTPSNSVTNGCFIIERSRATTGEATAEAFVIATGSPSQNNNGRLFAVVGNGGSSTSKSAIWNSGSPVALPYLVNGANVSTAVSLSKDGVTAPVFPIPCIAPGVTPFVSNMMVAVHPADAGATSVIQAATINGETRVYRAWPFMQQNGIIPTDLSYRICPAILWAVD